MHMWQTLMPVHGSTCEQLDMQANASLSVVIWRWTKGDRAQHGHQGGYYGRQGPVEILVNTEYLLISGVLRCPVTPKCGL